MSEDPTGAPTGLTPPTQFGDAAPTENGLRRTLRRYVAALLRYKWLVLVITAGGSTAGFYASKLLAPEYVAQVMFWVELPDANNRGPIRNTELLRASAWVELLKAYTVLDYVVVEQKLYLSYAGADSTVFSEFRLKQPFRPGSYTLKVAPGGQRFELATPEGTVLQQGAMTDSVGLKLGFEWVIPPGTLPAGSIVQFNVVPPRDAARSLMNRLTTNMAENGSFLRLELRGGNPVHIASVLNSVADRYVTIAADLKQQKLKELAKILEEQMETAGASLHNAELALEGFRVRTVTLPSESSNAVAAGLESTRDPVFRNFFNLKIEREQLRRDRQSIDRALVQARDSALAVDALEIIPAVKSSSALSQALGELTTRRSELRTLKAKYTDQHAQVRQLLGQVETLEKRTIPLLAEELSAELSSRESKLETLVASASGELREMPMRANEEARLRREVAVAEQLYTALQARYEEARLAAASSVPDVRILDAATVPEQPVTDTRTRAMMLAIIGSLGLAVLAVILLDRIDSRFRYPEQVTHGLGLSILGAVPQGRKRKGAPTPEERTQMLESFRELQLNVRTAFNNGPVVLALTSPGPGDGKTFTTSNLALTFADNGHRTLLIDSDVRRGTQNSVFALPRKPGLTDFLAGRASKEEVIHQTTYSCLDVIPCGSRMQDGPKLLASAEMTQLVEQARSQYSVILIDCAPLGAGVDALVMGSVAKNLVLILRTGSTNRELAEAKLELLDRLPVRVLGAILNAVPQREVYGYYAYTAGYEARNEEEQYAAAEER